MDEILVLKTTVPEVKDAERIANLLLQKRIAACVSYKEIHSAYIWNGRIEKNNEVEIVIKSTSEKLNYLIDFLKVQSSYEVPQIIYKFYRSEVNYSKWIQSSICLG